MSRILLAALVQTVARPHRLMKWRGHRAGPETPPLPYVVGEGGRLKGVLEPYRLRWCSASR